MLHHHWINTGRYTNQEPADDDYCLAPHIWDQIGCESAVACKTIPSQFVGFIPDIAKFKYNAEFCVVICSGIDSY